MYVGASLYSVWGMSESMPGAVRSAAFGSAAVLALVGGAVTAVMLAIAS